MLVLNSFSGHQLKSAERSEQHKANTGSIIIFVLTRSLTEKNHYLSLNEEQDRGRASF